MFASLNQFGYSLETKCFFFTHKIDKVKISGHGKHEQFQDVVLLFPTGAFLNIHREVFDGKSFGLRVLCMVHQHLQRKSSLEELPAEEIDEELEVGRCPRCSEATRSQGSPWGEAHLENKVPTPA